MTIVGAAGTEPVKVHGTGCPDAAEIPDGLSSRAQAPLVARRCTPSSTATVRTSSTRPM